MICQLGLLTDTSSGMAKPSRLVRDDLIVLRAVTLEAEALSSLVAR